MLLLVEMGLELRSENTAPARLSTEICRILHMEEPMCSLWRRRRRRRRKRFLNEAVHLESRFRLRKTAIEQCRKQQWLIGNSRLSILRQTAPVPDL
jgi:hypothetical protein